MMPFSPIIITPLALPGSPKKSLGGIRSGCAGRIPPSDHSSFKGELLMFVASKLIVTKEEGGHPSGMYSGVHICLKTLPMLHSTAVGYFNPSALKGISIR